MAQKIFSFLFRSHIGRMFFACILVVIGGLVNQYTEDTLHIGVVLLISGLALLLMYFFVMMYYAIKNTVNDFKNRRSKN